jgi:hypothetical protein
MELKNYVSQIDVLKVHTSGNFVSVFIIHHHHWQNSPFTATALLKRFCQICVFLRITPSSFHFFGFCNNNFFSEQGHHPCIQPPEVLINNV